MESVGYSPLLTEPVFSKFNINKTIRDKIEDHQKISCNIWMDILKVDLDKKLLMNSPMKKVQLTLEFRVDSRCPEKKVQVSSIQGPLEEVMAIRLFFAARDSLEQQELVSMAGLLEVLFMKCHWIDYVAFEFICRGRGYLYGSYDAMSKEQALTVGCLKEYFISHYSSRVSTSNRHESYMDIQTLSVAQIRQLSFSFNLPGPDVLSLLGTVASICSIPKLVLHPPLKTLTRVLGAVLRNISGVQCLSLRFDDSYWSFDPELESYNNVKDIFPSISKVFSQNPSSCNQIRRLELDSYVSFKQPAVQILTGLFKRVLRAFSSSQSMNGIQELVLPNLPSLPEHFALLESMFPNLKVIGCQVHPYDTFHHGLIDIHDEYHRNMTMLAEWTSKRSIDIDLTFYYPTQCSPNGPGPYYGGVQNQNELRALTPVAQ